MHPLERSSGHCFPWLCGQYFPATDGSGRRGANTALPAVLARQGDAVLSVLVLRSARIWMQDAPVDIAAVPQATAFPTS